MKSFLNEDEISFLIFVSVLVYRLILIMVECSPMAWKAGVQSQVESYQRLKK